MIVRPGIAGNTKAFYRNSISSMEKHQKDSYYVDKMSFKLYLHIIIATFFSVISRKKINSDSNNIIS